MPAPASIIDLVEKFRANEREYMQPGFVEMQTREEFINPFFTALGWDVGDKAGLGPARCDVKLEETIRAADVRKDGIAEVIGKRPDYSFRIEGKRKFYVEAKKPHEDIERNRAHAFQVRAYGWSADLDISILTDFQELSIYNCNVPPVVGDLASTALLPGFHLTYAHYVERWDDIQALLHRDAVAGGSIERYIEREGVKRGVLTVDAAFLKDISDWRGKLALDVAARNPHLSQRDLNYAVQMIINRIIFLRICEDRGIEPLERLKGAAKPPSEATMREGYVYRELVGLFQRADERYNSGLFHFQQERDRHEHPDTFTLGLSVGDDVLTTIISHLYHPYPYKFDAMPVEILGQVYEQFLGKVIVKQPGGGVAVEDKPEVRKAGGVYYTPTYIVDYIVGQTVGRLVDGKTPGEVSKLRVLDPACGSGSFLIGAYQHLLDWHLNYYLEHGPEQFERAPRRKAGPLEKLGGEWRLTIDERKRILRDNIYGVDIDTQAVEVTKLSLLLKVLEGETESTLGVQARLVGIERVLPDLGDNIKAGNSLIGPDFYETTQMAMFAEDEMQRINVFDWNQAFPQIMRVGGFDAVIGNPPYGADYTELEKLYFQSRFVYKKGKPETYIFFLERGVALLKHDGLLGYITPNAWLTNYYGIQLRQYMLTNTRFIQVVDLEPTRVFQQAVVDTAISVVMKSNAPFATVVSQGTKDGRIVAKFTTDQSIWEADAEAVINLQAEPMEIALIARMEALPHTLNEVVEYSQGVIPYKTREEGLANLHIAPEPLGDGWLPLIERAAQVRRYAVDQPTAYINYGPWLWCARDPRFFSQPKILFHRVRKKLPRQLVGAIDYSNAINRHSLSILVIRPGVHPNALLAVLGLFNSRLANWWFVKRYGMLMEVGGFKLMRMPLPDTLIAGNDRMMQLVTTMLDLHKRLQAANTPYDKASIETRINYTDAQIDRLVYELYGLTEQEIAIVEGGGQ